MDKRLGARLKKIEEQIETLSAVEKDFLNLDAHKDVLFAELFRKSAGKSVADREADVYASQEWRDFSKGLAETQAEFHRQRRWYELRLKAYDGEHITYKVENAAILRQGA